MSAELDLSRALPRVANHLLHFDLPIGLASYLLVPLGAWFAYCQHAARDGAARSAAGFARYCIPRGVITSRSCRIDIGYVAIKHFVNSWLLAPILVSSAAIATLTHCGLETALGPRPGAAPGMLLLGFVIALCVLVQDFTQFLIHYVASQDPNAVGCS